MVLLDTSPHVEPGQAARGYGLQIATEGLSGRNGATEQTTQVGDRVGVPQRQRATIGQHVGDAGVRPVEESAGKDGRQGRVQIG